MWTTCVQNYLGWDKWNRLAALRYVLAGSDGGVTKDGVGKDLRISKAERTIWCTTTTNSNNHTNIKRTTKWRTVQQQEEMPLWQTGCKQMQINRQTASTSWPASQVTLWIKGMRRKEKQYVENGGQAHRYFLKLHLSFDLHLTDIGWECLQDPRAQGVRGYHVQWPGKWNAIWRT